MKGHLKGPPLKLCLCKVEQENKVNNGINDLNQYTEYGGLTQSANYGESSLEGAVTQKKGLLTTSSFLELEPFFFL